MAKSIDGHVLNHGIRIATRDHGGVGPSCLLLHGAGRSLADWTPLVFELRGSCRLVAMDLRGHGLSDDGPWTLDALADDVRAVVAHYDLSDPVLIGHSLGGMLALLLAGMLDDLRAAISFDGFALHLRDHVGLPSTEIERGWERFWAETAQMTRVGAEEAEAEIDALARHANIPRGTASDILQRVIRPDGEGSYRLRCGAETVQGIGRLYSVDLLREHDLFARIRSSPARQLLIKSSDGDRADGRPDWQQRLHAAYHTGLDRQLQALASSDRISVERIEADHFMIISHAPVLADRVRRFLHL